MPTIHSSLDASPPSFPGSTLSQPLLDAIAARAGRTATLERHAAHDTNIPAHRRLGRTAARLAPLLDGNAVLLLEAARGPLRADIADVAAAATSAGVLLRWLANVVLAIEHPSLAFEVTTSNDQLALAIRWVQGDATAEVEAHLAAGIAMCTVRGRAPAADVSSWLVPSPGALLVHMGRSDRVLPRARPDATALSSAVAALHAESEGWHAAEGRYLATLRSCASCFAPQRLPLPFATSLVVALVSSAGARQVAIRSYDGTRELVEAGAGDASAADEIIELRDRSGLRGTLEIAGAPAAEVGRTIAPVLAHALERARHHRRPLEELARLGEAHLAIARATALGRTAKEIANEHEKSPSWVRLRLRQVFRALGVRSKVALVPLLRSEDPPTRRPVAEPPSPGLSIPVMPLSPFPVAATATGAEALSNRAALHAIRVAGRKAARAAVAIAGDAADLDELKGALGDLFGRPTHGPEATIPYPRAGGLVAIDCTSPLLPYLLAVEELVQYRATALARVTALPSDGLRLTPRQRDVLRCRQRGMSNAAIQAELGIGRTALAKHLVVVKARLAAAAVGGSAGDVHARSAASTLTAK